MKMEAISNFSMDICLPIRRWKCYSWREDSALRGGAGWKEEEEGEKTRMRGMRRKDRR